ncbi:type I glyceraldehyde-3-phosphate dehydrogenase [Chitinophaga japonensis]|uniref:Glyceraldehyde-3-phosphate dehydrogenase n=1 Tax=Chitinophaga japonensis TaxID=104662 RepID=A0A562TCD3_CHIJA|nr:type I glyceraldehyde-3-phosphate dehydrogenase [Chitinophaga japonensis]TWI90914.1 glyceraldehyde-3-phosphate dehydrogenase (NAD+) [Chitinophaga japonensis]
MLRVAINGFGRIGRMTFRKLFNQDNVKIVAVNDLSTPEMLAYLLKYDSVHGVFPHPVSAGQGALIINEQQVNVYAERNPERLPWDKLDIDIVLECTGIFESREKGSLHLAAGARKVIISAPSDNDVKTIVFNVNHHILRSDDRIISAASCTTNCLAPLAKVLHEHFIIVSGQMNTIHAYTNSQPLMDVPDKKAGFRKSRAAADSIIPFTTGAAKAIGLVIPELNGKLDGSSQRVPVHSGSLVELYTILEKATSPEEINDVMRNAANASFGYNEDPIVSQDIIGTSYGAIFDATQTKITGSGSRQLVKTAAWYDNEMSFVSQMVRTMLYFGAL